MSRKIGEFVISSDEKEIKIGGKWRTYAEVFHCVKMADMVRKSVELIEAVSND